MSKNNRDTDNQMNVNRISHGTEIVGTINAVTDLRIDGKVEGNINCKGKVIIGKDSCVKGDIISKNLDVDGRIDGTITINELLCLKETALVNGNVQTRRLSIEAGAEFNGNCQMSEDIPELNF